MSLSRQPTNIARSNVFVLEPGEYKYIHANDVFLLMPIWKKSDCSCFWVDATGTYDLCMDEEQLRYKIRTWATVPTTYMYRFIPGHWFAKRQGVQSP